MWLGQCRSTAPGAPGTHRPPPGASATAAARPNPLPCNAPWLQAMLDWAPTVERYNGYVEMDLLGPKVGVQKPAAV